MTAWGDQPPLSRRQVRMNQRGTEADVEFSQAQASSATAAQAAQLQTDHEPFNTFPGPAKAVEAERESADSGPVTGTFDGVRPGSRRAQRLAETGGISLDDTPPFDGAAFRVRDFRPAEPAPNPAVAAGDIEAAAIAAGRPLTRRELRALEAARAAAEAPESADEASEPASASADFEFSASTVADTPVESAAAPAAPIFEVPVYEAPVEAEPVYEAPVYEAPVSTVHPLIEPPQAYSPSSYEVPAEPVAVEPVAVEPVAVESVAVEPSSVEPTAVEPITAEPTAAALLETTEAEPVAEAPAAPEQPASPLFDLAPPTGVPFGTSPTEIPTLADLPAPPADPAFVPQYSLAQYPPPTMLPDFSQSARGFDSAPEGQTAPIGHWSTQEALDDAAQAAASAPSRDVAAASGPITSSALVLPAIPAGADLSVPFSTSTGEVLITGSINLPSTLGTTGAHPIRYDHSDLDAIIDAVDRDDIESDSAPVRAIRAVSTHTSPRDVIAVSRNTGGNRLPIVLAITAGAMMVSVTVLVVVGFVFDTF
jgi:hypothetical protein